MKIEFTKEQYKSLLKLIYCWNVMINWPRLHEDRIIDIYNLCSHIYSKSKEFWFEGLTEYWEEENIHTESALLDSDDKIGEYINYYNDDIFWNTLVDWLVDRDLEEKSEKESDDVEEKVEKLSEYYWEEFNKNAIKNLKVINTKK